MAKKRSQRGQQTSKSGTLWTKDELEQVFAIYPEARVKIHEENSLIQALGKKLGRTTRSVESQLLMFRSLERGGSYSRKNMNSLCREIWEEQGGVLSEKTANENSPFESSDEMSDKRAKRPRKKSRSAKVDSKLGRLLERAFGGEDVAIAPGSDMGGFWPEGSAAMGATDVCDRLINHLNKSKPGDTAEWVFLIGGAGNGKSFLANSVASKVDCEEIEGVDENRHHRTYSYSTGQGRELLLVNDATIPRDAYDRDQNRGALCRDIYAALAGRKDLLACVNRGILIGERHEVESVKGELGNAFECVCRLIDWLISPGTAVPAEEDAAERDWFFSSFSLNAGCNYYAMGKVGKGKDVSVNVHLVNMDFASICESSMKSNGGTVAWDDAGQVTCEQYDVLRRRKDGKKRRESPAFIVMDEVLRNFDGMELKDEDNPILANVATLRDSRYLEGLVEVLRGAEIVSGHRFTYRELWGVFCVAALGYVRPVFLGSQGNRVAPEDWFPRALAKDDDELYVFLDGGIQRTHMSLFGATVPRVYGKEWKGKEFYEPSSLSAVRHLLLVDPSKDVLPAWAKVISDAIETIRLAEHQKPSGRLKEELEGFADAWQPFDDKLESILLDRIRSSSIKDRDRRMLQAWLGSYLYRFGGILQGVPAFSDVIDQWAVNWRRASKGLLMSDDFQRGLSTLLTGEGEQAELILPLLSSRTEPVQGEENRDYLAMVYNRKQIDDFALEVEGDNLVLVLGSNSDRRDQGASRVNVDFSMCRDVICCKSGAYGFTNQSHITAPRVERMRAELLSTKTIETRGHKGEPGVVIAGEFYPFE